MDLEYLGLLTLTLVLMVYIGDALAGLFAV
jgi:hypothetical protein